MTDFLTATKLVAREECFRVPGPREGASLFLRYLPTEHADVTPRRAVLYVHGATFPSALSIAHRFDGTSWRDALGEAGFDVWGLDFYGYGHSDRYPEMDQPAAENLPLCMADDASTQVETAVRFILAHQNVNKIGLISHSWGSMPVGLFAGKHPALVDRLVLLSPTGCLGATTFPKNGFVSALTRRSLSFLCRAIPIDGKPSRRNTRQNCSARSAPLMSTGSRRRAVKMRLGGSFTRLPKPFGSLMLGTAFSPMPGRLRRIHRT